MRAQGFVVLVSGLVLAGVSPVAPPPADADVATLPRVGTLEVTSASARAENPAIVERRLVGRSVKKRKIYAYRLGESGKPVVMVIAAMHGDEPAPTRLAAALIEGPPIHGIDLWVVPRYNPDGLARHTRRNAHGVDLNRNYPYKWARLDGAYESGPRPRSEPETRAMMRFVKKVRPTRILSFHQPLHGVDTDTKRPGFAKKVAKALHLPAKRFTCGGVCHGTMTMWFNHRFPGVAITVEYGPHPGRRMMRTTAPNQVVRVLGGRRGD